MCVCMCEREGVCEFEGEHTQYYRVAKTHRIPYLYRSFSTKVTYI